MPGSTPHKLQFRFRGNRNYVQSADIVQGLQDWAKSFGASAEGSAWRLARLQMNRLVGCHCVVTTDAPEGERPAAVVDFVGPDSKGFRVYLRVTDETVEARDPYDEAPLAKALYIQPQDNALGAFRAAITHVPGYTALEHVIFAQKGLSSAIVGHDRTKWLAAQIVFDEFEPNAFSRIELTPQRVVGERFVSCDFAMDGKRIGTTVYIAQPGTT
jgi:hypothetical protein